MYIVHAPFTSVNNIRSIDFENLSVSLLSDPHKSPPPTQAVSHVLGSNMFSRMELRLHKVRVNLLLSLFIDRSVNTKFQRSVVIYPKWQSSFPGLFSAKEGAGGDKALGTRLPK